MIMIDPKMLELSIYEGIPHLLLPVVTDPKKANLALRWAVEEMERRYDLISRSGVRDIASYNKKVEKRAEGRKAEREAAPQDDAGPMIQLAVDGALLDVGASEAAVRAAGGVVDAQVREEISAAHAALQRAAGLEQMHLGAAVPPERKLPYIVIVIDEFADLMMVASKEVEQSVARIAQKARAAGIHLMLATQRPSVDVITGLIKANFPSRIAFQVASRVDARTILDQQGAESLLGMGDMLFTDRGLALRRIHGPLVTDGEIHKIVEYLKSQGKPVYDLDILKPRVEDGEDGEGEGEGEWNDEMYDQAVAVVSEMPNASTSMLQRRLRLGYNRAARIIERMEREGIVGPADGARPREVLVRSHAA
jgi:DNA segregation ATPase FtsK/SpoIIIE, S-DNA-T family